MNRYRGIMRGAGLGLSLLVTMPVLAGSGGTRSESGTRKPQVVAIVELPSDAEAQRERLSGEVQRSFKARKVPVELVTAGGSDGDDAVAAAVAVYEQRVSGGAVSKKRAATAPVGSGRARRG